MTRFIDLTHPIEFGMPVWPGDRGPRFEDALDLERDGCATQSVWFQNHLGTHLDAPSHFIRGGMTVDQIPMDALVGKAAVLDLSGKKRGDRIDRDDLFPFRDRFRPGGRILLRTDWDAHFTPDAFYSDFPCLTVEAAGYIASCRIGLLGMDTPSPSPIDDPGQKIHKMLLGAGVLLLEGLKNLNLIDREACKLIALPLPLKGFSGSPCRAVAVV